jgi:hypothetical protein
MRAMAAVKGGQTRVDAYFTPDQDLELLRLAKLGMVARDVLKARRDVKKGIFTLSVPRIRVIP